MKEDRTIVKYFCLQKSLEILCKKKVDGANEKSYFMKLLLMRVSFLIGEYNNPHNNKI